MVAKSAAVHTVLSAKRTSEIWDTSPLNSLANRTVSAPHRQKDFAKAVNHGHIGRGRACAKSNHVKATRARLQHDHIMAEPGLKEIGIVARAALKTVMSRAAPKCVVAQASAQIIRAAKTHKPLISAVPTKAVVKGRAIHLRGTREVKDIHPAQSRYIYKIKKL